MNCQCIHEAELNKLHTWKGLMSLLDEHYPSDIFTGESGDVGVRIVVLIRELDKAKSRIIELEGK